MCPAGFGYYAPATRVRKMLLTHQRNAALAAVMMVMTSILSATQVHAESFTFDNKHTEVRFKYLIGILPGAGRFTDVVGQIEINETMPEQSRIVAVIKTTSLSTEEPFVEETLRGKDFFNVAMQPEIRFKSRSVRPTIPNQAELNGELTINGITKPVSLHVAFVSGTSSQVTRGGKQIVVHGDVLRATCRVRRSAFAMTAFDSLIADEIDIEIHAMLRKGP